MRVILLIFLSSALIAQGPDLAEYVARAMASAWACGRAQGMLDVLDQTAVSPESTTKVRKILKDANCDAVLEVINLGKKREKEAGK